MKLPSNDAMQHNIRQTASICALKKIHSLVEEDRQKEALLTRILHNFLLYGWLILLLLAGLAAHLMGVI